MINSRQQMDCAACPSQLWRDCGGIWVPVWRHHDEGPQRGQNCDPADAITRNCPALD